VANDDYWHWRLQAAARRELLRLIQLLSQSAGLATLDQDPLRAVLAKTLEPGLEPDVHLWLEKLRAVETEVFAGPELCEQLDQREVDKIARTAREIFSLTVSALERRQQILSDARAEVNEMTRQLHHARDQENQEILRAEELRAQVIELRSRLSASEYERSRQLPALQSFFSEQQSHVRHNSEQLGQLQVELRDLSVRLREEQVRNEFLILRNQSLTRKLEELAPLQASRTQWAEQLELTQRELARLKPLPQQLQQLHSRYQQLENSHQQLQSDHQATLAQAEALVELRQKAQRILEQRDVRIQQLEEQTDWLPELRHKAELLSQRETQLAEVTRQLRLLQQERKRLERENQELREQARLVQEELERRPLPEPPEAPVSRPAPPIKKARKKAVEQPVLRLSGYSGGERPETGPGLALPGL